VTHINFVFDFVFDLVFIEALGYHVVGVEPPEKRAIFASHISEVTGSDL
jgi:hypothetical protein